MLQILTGQVYSLEADTFIANKGKADEQEKEWVRFRLGMTKPYTETVSDGNGGTTEQRQKTFVTVKCFNGLAPTLIKYFGGDDNSGKWIQLFGHWEENNWTQTVEVDNPANPNEVFELEVPTKRLEFLVDSFNFIGSPPPQQSAQPKAKNGITVKSKSKTATSTPATNRGAAAAEKEILDDDAPF